VTERPTDLAAVRVVSGDGSGTTAGIGPEGVAVGRDAGCDVVLSDPQVAPRHIHLQPLPSGSLMLNDLDLQRGTWVDDERVTCAVLRGGERIRIGDTVLEVDTVGTSAPEGPPGPQPVTPAHSPSMLERVRLRRSVNRATALAGVALVAAVLVGLGFATGILGGGEDTGARVAAIVERAAPSTVLVQAQRGATRTGSGTGWVLDADEGLIVTSAHVLNAGSRYTVGVGTALRRASVVGVSQCEDLAVLRVGDTRGLRSLPLGSQESLRQGQTVVAVGFPGSASASDALTSTVGVVSVVRSEYREPALDLPPLDNVVQTDAAINPGNSGGPLLTLDGRLVGVNSAGRTVSSGGRIIQGQSFAIGVDRVREVVGGLRAGRSPGWYGLGFRYLSASELRRRDLPAGLLVASVVDGSPAARAGIRPGELLLTAVEGRPVGNSLAGYCEAVEGIQAGMPIRVSGVNVRTGERRTLTLR